jgi:hypothetical protein
VTHSRQRIGLHQTVETINKTRSASPAAIRYVEATRARSDFTQRTPFHHSWIRRESSTSLESAVSSSSPQQPLSYLTKAQSLEEHKGLYIHASWTNGRSPESYLQLRISGCGLRNSTNNNVSGVPQRTFESNHRPLVRMQLQQCFRRPPCHRSESHVIR